MTNIGCHSEAMVESHQGYEVGTFPRKSETLKLRYVCIFFFLSINFIF